jgi:2-polyprenyl-3-methyl-5-hydroxy-6-metoxy-1,4-benzoquinol methylase
MTATAESIQCPLCASERSTTARSVAAAELVTGWQQLFKIDITDELRDVPRIDLLACQECALQFYVPRTLAGSPRLYEKLQVFDWYYMAHKWEHDAALEDLNGASRILEVGCGFGDFVARLRGERGLNAEGVELNARAVEESQRRGLPVKLLDVRELARQRPGAYDAVCSFQVLEHLTDPRGVLESACALVKPGGRVLLGVPNAEGFLKFQFNLLDMPPHHMTRWSVRAFANLQRQFPLKLKRFALEPLAAYHTLDYVDAQCARLIAGGVPRVLIRGRFKLLAADVLRWTRVHRLLRGHTLYVCLERQ